MSDYTDQDIFRKVSTLLQNIEQNQQVQQAAYENGIDVKNSTRLTAATKDNLAVSVIALLLAKRNNDPRCKDLVDFGLKHRTTKVDIINDYKAEANALITRYRNGERPEPEVQITINTESYLSDDEDEIYTESYLINEYDKLIQEDTSRAKRVIGGTIGFIVALPIAIVVTALGLVIKLISTFIGLFRRISPSRLLKKIQKINPKDRAAFTFRIKEGDYLTISVGHRQFVELYEKFSDFTDEFSECVESETVTKNLRDKAQELIDLCDKFSEKLGGDASVKSQQNYVRDTHTGNMNLTYDQCVEWLKELEEFNISDLQQKNKKLQKCLSKLQMKNTFGADEHASEKKVGINDDSLSTLRNATMGCVSNIQMYINGQNRLLKQADIDFDFKATYDESVEKRRIEREKRKLEEKQDAAVRKAQQAKDDKAFEDSLAQAHELGFYFGYKPEEAIKRAEELRDDLKNGGATKFGRMGSYTADMKILEIDRRAMLRAASDLAKRDPETAKKIADILKDV